MADAQERQLASADATVSRTEARRSLSLMGRLFAGAEHTQLYVSTFLAVLCLIAWIALSLWGPNTPRVDDLIVTLKNAFVFLIGLFAGSLAFRS
jgi:hypothetical protein